MTHAEVLGAPDAGDDGPVLAPAPKRATETVTDLAVAGLYLPAGPGPEPIAGDFFEVLRLDDDVVALLVGDVAGHGAEAVGRMRRLRTAATAFALERLGPAALLAQLDGVMERRGEEEFATLWYGEYAPSTGALRYASAGHPPPALHLADGGVRLLAEADAPALGTGLAHALATTRTAHLPPGAVLVAYSDGLVERRRADFDDQLRLLSEVVQRACASAGTTPQDIAAEVLDALVPDQDQAEDDVCLLVVRRRPERGE